MGYRVMKYRNGKYVIIFAVSLFFIDLASGSLSSEFGSVILRKPTTKDCGCKRRLFYTSVPDNSSKQLSSNISSCSDEGTFYQLKQNVICYTLYLKEGARLRDFYLSALKYNLKMMRKFYPGYSMRIYTDVPLDPEICSLLCSNNDVFWCNIHETPSDGDAADMPFRTWRFLPFGDPTVEIMMSRDLDSAIIAREAEAVNDWLQKGDKAIAVMRDHGEHKATILAGMWQANNTKLVNGTAARLRDRLMKSSNNSQYRSYDQDLINSVIYKEIPGQIVAYDSIFCTKYRNQTEVRPFPTQRGNGEFVANFVNCNSTGCVPMPAESKYLSCPVECRPSYGKRWDYC